MSPGPRVLIFGERLRPPADEGIKKLTVHLARAMRAFAEVTLLTAHGVDVSDWGCEHVPANRLLASRTVADRVGQIRADGVIYIPTASLTAATLARAWLLRRYADGAPFVLVACQPRPITPLARLLARLPGMRTVTVAVMSERTARQAHRLGLRTSWLAPGVDLDRFRPLDAEARRRLRARYGFGEDDFVVAHVGHIRPGRNVEVLAALAQEGICPLLVGSTSTPQEEGLRALLEAAGVRVITEYLPRVEEVYQLANSYLFPTPYTQGEVSAIDVPLSVLEAMACDCPVVTTPFGGLPRLFNEGGGVLYAGTAEEMIKAVIRIRDGIPVRTRERVSPYTWARAARTLLANLAGGEGDG